VVWEIIWNYFERFFHKRDAKHVSNIVDHTCVQEKSVQEQRREGKDGVAGCSLKVSTSVAHEAARKTPRTGGHHGKTLASAAHEAARENAVHGGNPYRTELCVCSSLLFFSFSFFVC
jgi:hypothetical protein